MNKKLPCATNSDVDGQLAFVLRPRDEVADIMEEVEPYRAMPMEKRDEMVQRALRFVDWWLRDVDGAREKLDWAEPMPESSEILWRKLVAAGRKR